MQSLSAFIPARLPRMLLWLCLAAALLLTTLLPALPAWAAPDRPGLFLPVIRRGSAPSQPGQPIAAWLDIINSFRTPSGLSAISENSAWSAGCVQHSRYAVINDVLSHSEDPGKPGYTGEGSQAAGSSNLYASSDVNALDETAIAGWMQGPFHALGILDPALQTSGYGSYREAGGSLAMAACLDVLRGRGSPGAPQYPIVWPADGAQITLTSHRSEYPNPLTSCPGYQAPSGLPIVVQLGSGALAPQVSAHAVRQGGQELEHCVFTETTYSNPDAAAQDLGRAILDQHDAVVLIPRRPLMAGQTYQVSLVVDGVVLEWSFGVAP